MEVVIATVVGLILIWISIKIVKLVLKLILWLIAVGLILSALGHYYNWGPFSPEKTRQQEHRNEPARQSHQKHSAIITSLRNEA